MNSKEISKKARVILTSSLVVLVVVGGIAVWSSLSASSEPYYSPEKKALLEEKEQFIRDCENGKVEISTDEPVTDEERAELKAESDRIDAQTNQLQKILDNVSEKTGCGRLDAGGIAEEGVESRYIRPIVKYLKTCKPNEEEEMQLKTLLNMFSMNVSKTSEDGKLINEATHIYDQKEEAEKVNNSSELTYDFAN